MERRSQSRFDRKRFTTSDPARIEVLSMDHRNPQIEATLIDVSNHGLGFSLEQKVEPGAALKIEIRDAMVLGEAVHCTPSGTAFVLGREGRPDAVPARLSPRPESGTDQRRGKQ